MKKCMHCRRTKKDKEFQDNAARPDGKQDYCKNCQNFTQRLYNAANKEQKAISNRKWREKNPNYGK